MIVSNVNFIRVNSPWAFLQTFRKQGECAFVRAISQRATNRIGDSVMFEIVGPSQTDQKAKPLRFIENVVDRGMSIREASMSEYKASGVTDQPFEMWHTLQVLKLGVFALSEQTKEHFPGLTRTLVGSFVNSPFFASCGGDRHHERRARINGDNYKRNHPEEFDD